MTAAAITAFRRQMLEHWIEQAIALLDQMDGDPDLEDDDREADDAERDMPGLIRGGAGL